MSGITLSAKDLKKDLRILDVILLKIFFNKEKEMFEALKEKLKPAIIEDVLRKLEEQSFIKILGSNISELDIDEVVLRVNSDDLFKEESDSAVAVLNYLNYKITKNDPNRRGFSTKSTANKKFIIARLAEGYTIDDLKKVIDYKVDEWMNTKYEDFLRPETLFNPTKFASYLVNSSKKRIGTTSFTKDI